jgi:prepilin-type N-terminal cleavage/methylation domain-containing protein
MRRSARRGYSLIEMLAAIAVLTVVLGASTALIDRLLKLDRSARAHRDDWATAGRLARAFRGDAHAAAFALTPPGAERSAAELRLRGPSGHDVVYEFDQGTITRLELVEGLPARGETFRLPGRLGHFELRHEGSRGLVALDLAWPTGRPELGVARSFRVVAALGLDHRFEGVGEDRR